MKIGIFHKERKPIQDCSKIKVTFHYGNLDFKEKKTQIANYTMQSDNKTNCFYQPGEDFFKILNNEDNKNKSAFNDNSSIKRSQIFTHIEGTDSIHTGIIQMNTLNILSGG